MSAKGEEKENGRKSREGGGVLGGFVLLLELA